MGVCVVSTSRETIPRRVEGIDIASLPLSPTDAFVLSQLDGTMTLDEIVIVTGMSLVDVRATLRRLKELGAVHSARDPRTDDDIAIPKEERVFAGSAPPPVEDVDLDAEQRERISSMFERLGASSHYQLLGVEPDAEKKEIKNAYYALIPLYHPDKFFGRNLGSYKKKLERIFERLAEAEKVLTRKSSREEYDEYLGVRRETRAFDAVLTSIPPPRPSTPPLPPVPKLAPEESARERSRALARRLTGPRRVPSEVTEPEVSREERRERAGQSMRQFLAAKRSPRIDRFVRAGTEALASGNWVSAVNALRIATNLAPDDTAIRELYEQADVKATEHLADGYESSAKYEEKYGHWDEAAKSWLKVAAGRPDDASPLRRAAECYLHTSDPREGIKPAREAVMLAPGSAECHTTLARAYEASELLKSAIGEVERAIELKPESTELRDWLKRLQKM